MRKQPKKKHLPQLNQDVLKILDNLAEGFISLDKEWNIIYINPEGERLLKVENKNAQGHNLKRQLGLPKNSLLSSSIAKTLKAQSIQHFEYYLQSLDRWFQIDIYPTDDGVSLYLNDISIQKELEGISSETTWLLDAILDTAPIGFAFIDQELRYKKINNVLAKMNNLTVPEHIGKTIHDIIPHIADEVAKRVQQVMNSGQPIIDVEFFTSSPTDPTKSEYRRERFYPIKDQHNEIIGVGVIVSDVTLQKRFEETLHERMLQQATIAELSHQALSGIPLIDIMQSAVTQLASLLNVEYTKILQLEPHKRSLVLRAGVGWKPKYTVNETRVGAGKNSQAGWTLRSEHPVIVKNLKEETRFQGPPLLKDHNVLSGMSVIIEGHDGPYGVLGAHTTNPREFTKDDVHFLQSVANIIALAIERRRIEDALETSKNQLDAILQNIADGVTVQDTNGSLVFANDVAARATGFKNANEMMRIPLRELHAHQLKRFELYDENGKPLGYEALPGRLALKGDKKPESIIQFYDKVSGQTRWSHIKARPVFDRYGKVQYAVNIFSDITDQKHIEEALKFKAEASRLLSTTLDYEKTLKNVAHMAVPEFADWCSIDMLDDDQNLKQVAVVHNDPKKLRLAKKWRKQFPTDLSADYGIAKVIKTGKHVFVPHITDEVLARTSLDNERITIINQIGFNSVIILPLKAGRASIGAITFVMAESKRKFTAADLELAIQLAARASMAIENAKLYEKVTNEQQRMNDLVSTVPGVVWESWGEPDSDKQRIDFVSNYVEKMLGYSTKEWLETPNFWLQIVHPDDKEQAAREATQIYQQGGTGKSVFRWMKKNGEAIWVEAQSYVIKDKKGRPIGMRGVTLDITERMELQKRKDEFISMASHELKTPLTTIKAFSQLLEKYFSQLQDEKATRYLSKMDTQIDKLTMFIEDLLDVSRIESGKLKLKKEVINLQELIQQVMEDMQTTTQRHKIQLKGSFAVDICADSYRLEQVLTNLLSNAIKYSPDADSIIVKGKHKKDWITLEIQDFGIGIPPEKKDKIFERFYRAEEVEKEHFTGLGLGLHISHEIIKRHGGKLEVTSTVGKGSTFYVHLPIYQA